MKKYLKLIILIIFIIIIISILLYIKNSDQNVISNENNNDCIINEYPISVTLQSGEKGIVFIKDHPCFFQSESYKNDLTFTVLEDGSIRDNTNLSRLFIWMRDNNLSAEEQMINLLTNKYNKNNFCLVKKSDYEGYSDFISYNIYLNNIELPKDYCYVHGIANDGFAYEGFIVVNNLLIMERHEGVDGMGSYDQGSIRFIED